MVETVLIERAGDEVGLAAAATDFGACKAERDDVSFDDVIASVYFLEGRRERERVDIEFSLCRSSKRSFILCITYLIHI